MRRSYVDSPNRSPSRCLAMLAIVLTCLSLAEAAGQDSPPQPLQRIDFEVQRLTDIYYSEGIAVGDLNGDGHQDIVYGPHWYAGPAWEEAVEIYPATPQPRDGYADNFFSWVYDFNGDGAQDVLVVGFPGTPAHVYENPGEGVGQWKRQRIADWVANESPQWTDLVGDERPELVCTRDGFYGYYAPDWNEPWAPWQFHPISERIAPPKFGHGLGVGDVNGDGRHDILFANGWFEQPSDDAGNSRWKLHEVPLTTSYGGADMRVMDVDGDGDGDIITSEAAHDFGLSWYEQLTPDNFRRHVIMGRTPEENRYGVLFTELHSLALADIDGDGLQDIVTGKTYWSHHRQSPMWDAGAVVYWFRLQRTEEGIDWIPFQAAADTGIGRQVTVVDATGDGLLDIAVGGMLGGHVLVQQRTAVRAEQYAQWVPQATAHESVASASSSPPSPAQKPVAGVRLRGGRAVLDDSGHLPGAIEGEELRPVVSGGTVGPQAMGGFSADRWSGGEQLWWRGARPGDWLEIPLDVLQPVDAIELVLTCARDYGVVSLTIDDQPLGEAIDLYEPEVVTTGTLEFPCQLQPGQHRLRIAIVGANPQAVKSFMCGLDCLRFRPRGGDYPQGKVDEIVPRTAEGQPVNVDFETGDLRDWTATGTAFADQPIAGDTVALRRNDMRSGHVGRYWIGGFERNGDAPQGTLTSTPFRVSHRYASFYVGGGSSPDTRIELWPAGATEPLYTFSGDNRENMQRVVVDLRRVEGQMMQIKLVDESSNGWGHLNFDHFRFHRRRPAPVAAPQVRLSDDQYPHRGLPAAEAAAVMKVPDGFSVTVFAAEPDVRQPIAMALDDRGRVWIAEAYEYPRRAAGDRGRDRILIFEDTDGDDVFDRRTVFYEGLNLVSGLEVGFGGVWVGAAPYLMFIPDGNGDDVPDGPPQVLLDGWGYQDTHETLNAFCWGPDGWLYGCHGVFTHSRVGKPGTPDEQRVPLNAAIWRYHPLEHRFEVFAHGTSNPWGVDFNEVGEAFATACVIPHLYHIIPGARYQRQAGQHFNPYTYDDIKTIADHLHYLGATPHSGNGKSDAAGGGHAHAGAMIYLGGTWPQHYRSVLFMNNIHGQRINTDFLEPSGSGYVGTHGPDFLLTGDQASQILNMRYGPDGNVYVIDWYDMQACHRNEVEVHDRSNGRIYKINYAAAKHRAPQVDLPTATDGELAQQCLATNEWYYRHARRLLQERAASAAIEQAAVDWLRGIAVDHQEPTRRLRALWMLHAIGELFPEDFARLELDPSPHVRSWAIRLQMQAARGRPQPHIIERWSQMAAEDPSPIVRLSLASAAGRLPPQHRWHLLANLMEHASDADDPNLPLMYWYALEPLADVDADRALALAMRAGVAIPLLRNFMLRRVAAGGSEEALRRLVEALGRADAVDAQVMFLQALRAALVGRRQATAPPQWPPLATRLMQSAAPEVRVRTAVLGNLFGDPHATAYLLNVLQDSQAETTWRQEALAALLSSRAASLPDLLEQLLRDAATPTSLLPDLIHGLVAVDAPRAEKLLLELYDHLPPEGRRNVLAAMTKRPDLAHRLVEAIESGTIPARDLTADLARRIQYLGDERLVARLENVWGSLQPTSAEKGRLIAQYKELVERTDLPDADVRLGRKLYGETCGRCHRLFGEGNTIGPDLTGSNRANVDYLLENIVDPSAVMAKEYRPEVVLTEDGQVLTGLVVEDTDRALILRSAEETTVVAKDEIVQRKTSSTSMMPDNQLQQFTEHEIRSLLAYLRSPSPVPLPDTDSPPSSVPQE